MTDLFSTQAADWDQRDTIQHLSHGIGTALRRRVDLQPHMEVLDFGAGTGLLTAHVAAEVARVTAVDTSPAMLERLMAKPELAGKVEALCQDILSTPLDTRFDLIISAMALHHVQDTAALMNCFNALLLPGGQIALADLDHEDGSFHPAEAHGVYHAGFQREALRHLLTAAGFVRIEIETAHEVHKAGKIYPVFLLTAVRPD